MAGYLIRLTECNYYPSPNYILQLAGLNTQRVFRLVKSTLEVSRLSQIIRLDENELFRRAYGAIVKLGQNDTWLYPLAKFSKKFCPLCLQDLGYWHQIWDEKLMEACPSHQCLLVTRCEGCHQELQGLRSSVTQCQCGFDFRQSSCQPASELQVNLAFYLSSLRGDDFCRHSLEQIYGHHNPIFRLNLAQFTRLLHFLNNEINFYFARLRMFPDAEVPDLIKLSYSVSWATFVFYLFRAWRKNFTQIFCWFEEQLLLDKSEGDTLRILTYFLSTLVCYLPEKWTFSTYASQYILDLLKRYKIPQIEIIGFEPRGTKVRSLSNLSQFLSELSAEFNIPHLTLACLLHSSVYLCYRLPDINTGLLGTVGCYFPCILMLNEPTVTPYLRRMYPSEFKV